MPIINPEFQKLIPALSQEEYNQLEKNIISDGCRDPLVLWEDTIIDGHNRFKICADNNLSFNVISKDFDSDTEVKEWMILNQFGKRNISNYQRAELALLLKPLLAEKAEKERVEKRADPGLQKSANDTRKEIADKAGVSHDTISRVERIQKEATPEIVEQVKTGEISINQAYKTVTTPANYSSESEDWYTPNRYMQSVRAFFDGIDLDPCSCEKANATVGAENIFTKEDDSLTKEWFGKVFINPPYGKDGVESVAGKFCNKTIEEYKKGNIDEAIILVNSSHTQKWQQPLYDFTICFVDHRIKFEASDGSKNDNPTFGNIFVYLGKRVDDFADHFQMHGYVMERVNA